MAYHARAITLEEIAGLVFLSPYHFLRQFKARFHATPYQMLMACRLSQAKRMLAR
ncbi:AraC family transcriptional regulator, partial [Sodalis-like symbiont of Bactericera trigonica]